MEDLFRHDKNNPYTREYLNYPSLLLREVKACPVLSHGSKHCWEVLLELAKFNKYRSVTICLEELAERLNRGYRMTQNYITQLVAQGFIVIKKNFDKRLRVENTYILRLPPSFEKKVKQNNRPFWVEEGNRLLSPMFSRLEINCQSNKEKLNNINNCYFKESSFKTVSQGKGVFLEQGDLESGGGEVVTLFPCVKKPVSRAKALLKHCLTKEVELELSLGESLTKRQEWVVGEVANFFAPRNGGRELSEWITSSILNSNAFTRCKTFLHKLNAIITKLRDNAYTRPFGLRYQAMDRSAPTEPLVARQEGGAVKALFNQYFQSNHKTHKTNDTHHQSGEPNVRKNVQQDRVNDLKAQMERVMARMKAVPAEAAVLGEHLVTLKTRLQEMSVFSAGY